MKKKYYLSVEFRYNIRTFDEDGYEETDYQSREFQSKLFDVEKDCIDYGNKLIEDNLWIEQYPGLVGDRLNRRYGYPLVAPHLKNGTQIYIKVVTMDVRSLEELDVILKKFDCKSSKLPHKITL